jgi:hypothetical protein
MNDNDIDPTVRKWFPWALFLILAAALAFGATRVHAEDDIWACYGSARYQAMSSGWTPCTEMHSLCDKLKAYLTTHSKAEARAEAIEKHIPQWIVRKAERCLP